MKLIIIQGDHGREALAFAKRLSQAGYQHYDLTWFANRFKNNPTPEMRKRYVEAKLKCKRDAVERIHLGHSIVISTDYFRSADRVSFKSLNCEVEVLTVSRATYAHVLSRVQALVSEQKNLSVFSRMTTFFYRLRRSIARHLVWN